MGKEITAHGVAGTLPGSGAENPYKELQRPPIFRPISIFGYLFLALLLYMGWRNRDANLLNPKSGLGYALGVVGGSMMLLLLLYPLRKKVRFMQRMGPTKYWFRAHMIFGILGPFFTIFHSNFHIRSQNSKMVMAAMLLVTGSGFIGMYFYTKIHYGLYGRRLTMKELQRDFEERSTSLLYHFRNAPHMRERLKSFEDIVLSPSYGLFESAARFVTVGMKIRWTHLILLKRLKHVLREKKKREGLSTKEVAHLGKIAKKELSTHLDSALKIAEFSLFERFFSLWHLFHFPLFLMLVVTVLIHVVAVHMF